MSIFPKNKITSHFLSTLGKKHLQKYLQVEITKSSTEEGKEPNGIQILGERFKITFFIHNVNLLTPTERTDPQCLKAFLKTNSVFEINEISLKKALSNKELRILLNQLLRFVDSLLVQKFMQEYEEDVLNLTRFQPLFEVSLFVLFCLFYEILGEKDLLE